MGLRPDSYADGMVEVQAQLPGRLLEKVRERDSYNSPVLLVSQDVVLSADREGSEDPDNKLPWKLSAGSKSITGTLIAYSSGTGKKLWEANCSEAYGGSQDVFVINNDVHVGDQPKRHAGDFTQVYDLHTGKVSRTLDTTEGYPKTHHHRCYRNKATINHIIMGRTGIEFLDVKGGPQFQNPWTRGACHYGVMPANGLVYAPPHACGCYIQAKMTGFQAYAPNIYKPLIKKNKISGSLVKGKLYNKIKTGNKAGSSDWPTYRHDSSRNGLATSKPPSSLNVKWKKKMGQEITTPVYANGKVYIAGKMKHTLHALSGSDGKFIWSFTADGKIDSPPTISQGLAVFGTTSGSVYCLQADSGDKVWQFRAEKSHLRKIYNEQLESLWPVHGTVLVIDNNVYFAAGRSSYIDDGIYIYKVNLLTGKPIKEQKIYFRDPETGKLEEGFGQSMPGAISDILSFDGENIFMRHLRLNKNLEMLDLDVDHIHSSAGFLDGNWAHRTYWFYGTLMNSGWGGWGKEGKSKQSGRILVRNKDAIFGFGRKKYFNDFNSAPAFGSYGDEYENYRIYNADLKRKEIPGTSKSKKKKTPDYPLEVKEKIKELQKERNKYKKGTPERDAVAKQLKKLTNKYKKPSKKKNQTLDNIIYHWEKDIPFYVRAMVLTDDSLVIAGPEHILTKDNITDPKTLQKQVDVIAGETGAMLWIVSTKTGDKIKEIRLPSVPVFDGMIISNNKIIISTIDNTIICIGD